MAQFRSNAQRAKFHELVKQGKMEQSTLDQWEKDTPKGHALPHRITPERNKITKPWRKKK
jgi:hypothetical protein